MEGRVAGAIAQPPMRDQRRARHLPAAGDDAEQLQKGTAPTEGFFASLL